MHVIADPNINHTESGAPLPLYITVSQSDQPLENGSIDYYQFWKENLFAKHDNRNLVYHGYVARNYNKIKIIHINRNARYINLFAHYYSPTNKQWYSTNTLPSNFNWRHYSLLVAIKKTYVAIRFIEINSI